MTVKMCRRHSVQLFVAAFGTLLDLSGRLYMKRSRAILDEARKCPKCVTP